jgi:hypothetical protein
MRWWWEIVEAGISPQLWLQLMPPCSISFSTGGTGQRLQQSIERDVVGHRVMKRSCDARPKIDILLIQQPQPVAQ